MSFSSPNSWYIFIPLAFLISSIANAGFIISVFNRRYELMLEDNRIVYDNFFTGAIGFGFILGPMIGGFIKSSVEKSSFVMNTLEYANIRILYIISTIGILLLQVIYLLTQSKRKGNTNVKN